MNDSEVLSTIHVFLYDMNGSEVLSIQKTNERLYFHWSFFFHTYICVFFGNFYEVKRVSVLLHPILFHLRLP